MEEIPLNFLVWVSEEASLCFSYARLNLMKFWKVLIQLKMLIEAFAGEVKRVLMNNEFQC